MCAEKPACICQRRATDTTLGERCLASSWGIVCVSMYWNRRTTRHSVNSMALTRRRAPSPPRPPSQLHCNLHRRPRSMPGSSSSSSSRRQQQRHVSWPPCTVLHWTQLLFYATDLRREGHYKMMGAVCLSVRPSVCRVPRRKSRTERPRKPKIGTMEAHHTGNQRTYLEVKRSKVKVTRSMSQTMHHTQVGALEFS